MARAGGERAGARPDRRLTRLTGSSAVLLVSDIARAVEFWRERLGFECETYGDPPDFASARRDDASVLLALCGNPSAIVPNWKIVHNTWNVYIRVDDADAIYAELQERGAPIDYTIYDAPHGFREFGTQDPDGHDIAFGQPL
jgi:predicted enzyme related to lactoylglutathione lyase